jgi:hypothetical protein
MDPCPSPERLQQLLGGALDGPEVATLADHVAGCAACEALLDRLADDPELRAWRSADAPTPELVATPPGFPQLVHRPQGPRGAERLPFLEPPWREGDLGSLGPYLIEAELGRGGMGIVLRAQDEGLRRPVALKVLRPELAGEEARQRFVQEARAAAQVRHDHVVTVFAVANPLEGLPYFAMGLLTGPSLAELIRTGPALTPYQAASMVAQAADGLAAAHAAGLVHRDIKPANILLDSVSQRVKVTDFGLVFQVEKGSAGARLTQEGAVLGTPAYMSPEQARGSDSVDARTDVYGLGVTLYEALTGEVPFRGTAHLVLQRVLGEEPRPPRQLNDAVPRDLETICLKAMAKEPHRRYQSAAEFAADLRRWLQGEPIVARPTGRVEKALRWFRRNPRVAWLTGLLALTLITGFALVTWQWLRADANAAEALRSALARLTPVWDQAPKVASYRQTLSLSYRQLALVLFELDRPVELAALARARRLRWPAEPRELFFSACDLARCSGLIGKGKAELDMEEQKARAGFAAEALAVLGEAVRHGFHEPEMLASTPGLASVRDRAEFKKLQAELAAKVKAPPR